MARCFTPLGVRRGVHAKKKTHEEPRLKRIRSAIQGLEPRARLAATRVFSEQKSHTHADSPSRASFDDFPGQQKILPLFLSGGQIRVTRLHRRLSVFHALFPAINPFFSVCHAHHTTKNTVGPWAG